MIENSKTGYSMTVRQLKRYNTHVMKTPEREERQKRTEDIFEKQ